jgi:uncharacterized membrane protein YgcG
MKGLLCLLFVASIAGLAMLMMRARRRHQRASRSPYSASTGTRRSSLPSRRSGDDDYRPNPYVTDYSGSQWDDPSDRSDRGRPESGSGSGEYPGSSGAGSDGGSPPSGGGSDGGGGTSPSSSD